MGLSHVDGKGQAHMVDVGEKPVTKRVARARGSIKLKPSTLELITAGGLPKGDAMAVARVAGIMAAKKTPELIPLCHPLPIGSAKVEFTPAGDEVIIEAVVSTSSQTGVEMEALTAVSVAALTLYDMVKAVDKRAEITGIYLVEKTGGKSGHFVRSPRG
jgi:cyclic pyranopterin phosphate synthase